MSVSSINNANVSNYSTNASSTTRNTSELGEDDFLNLLMTQLKYQDPMEPMDDSQFISQMAQFSSLEVQQSMNATIGAMQAYSMVGTLVSGSSVNSVTGEAEQVQGIVDSVTVKNGNISVMVDGKELKVENVETLYDSEDAGLADLSSLMGLESKGYIYDPDTMDVMGVEGTITGASTGKYEDYVYMSGVETEVDSILSDDYSSSQDMYEYLQEHVSEEVELVIIDSTTGKQVPVKAKLGSVEQDAGKNRVTLDEVLVPYASLYDIKQ